MPGKPAARNTDIHVCPKTLPPPSTVPHGPGQIMAAGTARVFVNQLAAAVKNDMCICVEPGNMIKNGSSSVFFGGQPAARQMDETTHQPGGMIQAGSPNVFIGG
ncbi:PAAR domain-containing protein [Chitinophaga sp. 22321]|uniref:PAAR domain-containing protein n=1 Tax=Chitinophaga hostae TaxID=2831022 RepID=A0ABS5J457_9BACT|nr:PAAR domain-containing protein [Chitinophaga hostae]MBS0030001.1 PAAR domain-containing protein [Chitinophaga hostae]